MKKQHRFETRYEYFAKNLSALRVWTGLKTKKILSWPDAVRFPELKPVKLKIKTNDTRWH